MFISAHIVAINQKKKALSAPDWEREKNMRCPSCGENSFITYKTFSEKNESGRIQVFQYRKCKKCGETGKTTYDKWVCELSPQDYFRN